MESSLKNSSEKSNINRHEDDVDDEDEDPICVLTELCLQAAKPLWTKNEYNRILFCQVGDLKDFELSEDTFENNLVFLNRIYNHGNIADCIKIPVIYVLFYGRITNSKLNGDRHWHWFEIGNNDYSIICKADLAAQDNLHDVNGMYYNIHKRYRAGQREFKENPTIENKEATNRLRLLWQLELRSKQIFEKQNEMQLCEELVGRKVMVVGKLVKYKEKQHVIVKQAIFIKDIEEKRVLEMINLGKYKYK